jgi:serine/threonine protein kinase
MMDLDLSNRTLGEFVLREPIGVGGHGTVYRCEQRALGRDAVVKVLRPRNTNDAQAERFVREAARLAARPPVFPRTCTPSASRTTASGGSRWSSSKASSLGDG